MWFLGCWCSQQSPACIVHRGKGSYLNFSHLIQNGHDMLLHCAQRFDGLTPEDFPLPTSARLLSLGPCFQENLSVFLFSNSHSLYLSVCLSLGLGFFHLMLFCLTHTQDNLETRPPKRGKSRHVHNAHSVQLYKRTSSADLGPQGPPGWPRV